MTPRFALIRAVRRSLLPAMGAALLLALPACQQASSHAPTAQSTSSSADASTPGSSTIPDADARAAAKVSPGYTPDPADAVVTSSPGGERDHPAKAKAMVKKYTHANDPNPGPGLKLDPDPDHVTPIHRTKGQWDKVLSDYQYHILRERGTEPAFRNPYEFQWGKGVYACAACGLNVFSSKTKYDPHTGWPSYWAPIAMGRVKLVRAGYGGYEVVCARCGSHLGDMFNDGPPPTGHRYCLDSAALKFKPAGNGKKGSGGGMAKK